MDYKLHQLKHQEIAEYISEKELGIVEDFLDLIGNLKYQDINHLIVHSSSLDSGFLDLKTGLAGEVLQKFSTYDVKMTIVGDFSKVRSKSLRDFIRESNRMGRITFVESASEIFPKFEPGI